MADPARNTDRAGADPGIGQRLRQARLRSGLSTLALDALAGTARGHTSMIENGKRANIEVRTADSLAGVLGLSLDWLLRGHGSLPAASAIKAAVDRARQEIRKAES